MTGRKTLASLGSNLSASSRKMAAAKAAAMSAEMDLAELRRARALSQQQLATTLNIGQASVAKLEKRADMYLSTLRSYVEAMGGKLELSARFADHTVAIRGFASLEETDTKI